MTFIPLGEQSPDESIDKVSHTQHQNIILNGLLQHAPVRANPKFMFLYISPVKCKCSSEFFMSLSAKSVIVIVRQNSLQSLTYCNKKHRINRLISFFF